MANRGNGSRLSNTLYEALLEATLGPEPYSHKKIDVATMAAELDLAGC
jgi:hypothetical protein